MDRSCGLVSTTVTAAIVSVAVVATVVSVSVVAIVIVSVAIVTIAVVAIAVVAISVVIAIAVVGRAVVVIVTGILGGIVSSASSTIVVVVIIIVVAVFGLTLAVIVIVLLLGCFESNHQLTSLGNIKAIGLEGLDGSIDRLFGRRFLLHLHCGIATRHLLRLGTTRILLAIGSSRSRLAKGASGSLVGSTRFATSGSGNTSSTHLVILGLLGLRRSGCLDLDFLFNVHFRGLLRGRHAATGIDGGGAFGTSGCHRSIRGRDSLSWTASGFDLLLATVGHEIV